MGEVEVEAESERPRTRGMNQTKGQTKVETQRVLPGPHRRTRYGKNNIVQNTVQAKAQTGNQDRGQTAGRKIVVKTGWSSDMEG